MPCPSLLLIIARNEANLDDNGWMVGGVDFGRRSRNKLVTECSAKERGKKKLNAAARGNRAIRRGSNSNHNNQPIG